ncbi:hypothetical protein [Paraburkholderia sp. BCC1885]|uniref:hypothetical protein n=1 Tax=Paraburkholderia sp. BCC1885 TaxID=2562669 RepID=UPI0016432138|nr:hypothetical protein [Paraburkholderia sp. BCC1885]
MTIGLSGLPVELASLHVHPALHILALLLFVLLNVAILGIFVAMLSVLALGKPFMK